MNQPLRSLLEAMKFIDVTDTMQYDDQLNEIGEVKRNYKARGTFRQFRGVTVVYDTVGCVWIRPQPLSKLDQYRLGVSLGKPPLTWVPHVDDEGFYINHYFRPLGFPQIKIRAPRHKPR
jgi:hypothetical protein